MDAEVHVAMLSAAANLERSRARKWPTYPGPAGSYAPTSNPPHEREPMFSINLKSSLATLAVMVGLLALAGPAGANGTPLQNTMVSGVVAGRYGDGRFAGVETSTGFKSLSGMDSETEFMDYTDDS
jgi:hypothetical protein